MRKVLFLGLGVVLLAAIVLGGGWWLSSRHIELSWDAGWPETMRVTGEAVEPLVAGRGGELTDGDRARAAERARWKAYYFAQLRAAERLGALEIAAQTTIRNLTLADQELQTSYTDTVQAAIEVESEGSLEYLEDAVRARVVVEIPPERLVSLKGAILRALRSGRITFEAAPAAPPAPPSAPPEGQVTAAAEPAPEEPAEATLEAVPAAAEPSAGSGRAADRYVLPPAPRPQYSGAALYLLQQAGMVGAAPTIYDAAGSQLGSVFDLPSERITAGLPVASAGDQETIRQWAGTSPRGFEVTISQGNLFLTERLTPEEVGAFRGWLRGGRIVLVLGAMGA